VDEDLQVYEIKLFIGIGGGNEPGDQLSPVQVSTAQDRFEFLRTVEGQDSRPPDD